MRAHRFTPGAKHRPARTLCALGATLGLLVLAAPALAVPTPHLSTQASPSVSVGGTISDTAALYITDFSAPPPTGSVTFTAYGPDDPSCGTAAFTSPSITVKPGQFSATVSSGPFSPTLPGTYRWVATYTGSGNYAGITVTTKCADTNEAVLVTAVTPTITTVASPSVQVGGTVTDTATLVGGMAPTGTMRFRIYQPTDTSCAGPAVGGSDVTITDPASTTSAPFSPKQVGTYHWRAFYLGDHVNGIAFTACGDANESVDVTAGPATPGAPGSPGSGGGGGGASPNGPCDPAATAKAVLDGLIATLTGKPGAAFKASCSAGLRIVLRAKEIRPGNRGIPRRDGFTTMTNILTHIAPNGPPLQFALNPAGLALRDYALSQGRSLIGFLVVHVRPDKRLNSTEAAQILTLG